MTTLQKINGVVPSIIISEAAVEFELQVQNDSLIVVLTLLKDHGLIRANNLVEITAVDLPNNLLRFYLTYCLLSGEYNSRVRVSVQTNELQPVVSATSIFSSA